MKYCPKCRTEYRDEIVCCADCGDHLIVRLPPNTQKTMKNEKKQRISELFEVVVGGVLLFLSLNIFGAMIKPFLVPLTEHINMSKPMNWSIMVTAIMIIVGTLPFALIAFWILERADHKKFSVQVVIVAFLIHLFYKSGGLLGILLMLDDCQGDYSSMVFMMANVIILFLISFFTQSFVDLI